MFASTGEKLEDFDVFHPERMASRILGMGDMLTLIEQAERPSTTDETARMAERMLGQGGEFTLEDFLEQMLMVKRMGPIGNMLGMLPGMGQMKDAISQVDDRDLDRVAAIIRSMTPAERQDPKILNGSRRLRIARGLRRHGQRRQPAGDRFGEARKMMKQMGGMAWACPACAGPPRRARRAKAPGPGRSAPTRAAAARCGPALPRSHRDLNLPPGSTCRPECRCRRACPPDLSNLKLPAEPPTPT